MTLLTYVVRRTLLSAFVIFFVLLIVFILSHSISDNPITAWMGRAAGMYPELAEVYRAKYHLDEPLYIQFWYYLSGVLQGDLGYSVSKRELVSAVIARTLPYTIQIVSLAFLVTVLLGIPCGILSGRYANKKLDHGIRTIYMAGISSPPFFLALILMIVFSYTFQILPTGGAISPTLSLPTKITGFIILDSMLTRNWVVFFDASSRLIMPAMALALINFGYVTRILRSSILDVMNTNYIRTARAKGLSERAVFTKHALRNALISVITIVSFITSWLVAGSIFVESIFQYPGIGLFAIKALNILDYPGILGVTIVFALIMIIANLIADILYAIANPSITI